MLLRFRLVPLNSNRFGPGRARTHSMISNDFHWAFLGSGILKLKYYAAVLHPKNPKSAWPCNRAPGETGLADNACPPNA